MEDTHRKSAISKDLFSMFALILESANPIQSLTSL